MEITPNTKTRIGRMLMGGRLTATIRSHKTGHHITLTMQAKDPEQNWKKVPLAEGKLLFFEQGHGGYGSHKIGHLNLLSGRVTWKSQDKAWQYAVEKILEAANTGVQETEQYDIQEAELCGKCGAALTDPVSIERGFGPECYGMITGSEHYKRAEAARHQPIEPTPAKQTRIKAVPRTFNDLAKRL